MSRLMDLIQERIDQGEKVDFVIQKEEVHGVRFEWISSFIPSFSQVEQKSRDAGFLESPLEVRSTPVNSVQRIVLTRWLIPHSSSQDEGA